VVLLQCGHSIASQAKLGQENEEVGSPTTTHHRNSCPPHPRQLLKQSKVPRRSMSRSAVPTVLSKFKSARHRWSHLGCSMPLQSLSNPWFVPSAPG
jgi:hypothetical protein